MNEKPILMSGVNVRAILAGHKTQTRRVIKPQPVLGKPWRHGWLEHTVEMMDTLAAYAPHKKGDRLWVRETWMLSDDCQAWDIPGAFHEPKVIYRADIAEPGSGWRSPIFMPKWAARIWLEVTGVRVERVQDIDNDGIRAEGIRYSIGYMPLWLELFSELWDNINPKFPWESNPWVWVYEFSPCQPSSS
jgi:hypothetical protein